MADAPRRTRSTEGFFGRRHGKTIRPFQAEALASGLERYRIDLSQPAPPDLARLFPAAVSKIVLEIGFGGGEHLLKAATDQPDIGYVGVEPFVNGMAKLMATIVSSPLDNLRIYDDDAIRLLEWAPEASFDRIDLFYPDPWPKKRHWKRRFVSPTNLDRIARTLKPGGIFRFASDIDDYVNWTLLACHQHPSFEWMADDAADWHQPYEGWVTTRYEAKAIREGRRTAYLQFSKRQEGPRVHWLRKSARATCRPGIDLTR